MTTLQNLAKEIMETEFDNDSSLNSLQSIEAWLETNLGMLNSLINTSFCVEDQELDSEAQAVYRQAYLYHYYSKKARNALRGIMTSSGECSGDVISLNDGDSKVTFANKNETAKVIRGLANDAKSNLDTLVNKYNMYQSEPRQVSGLDGE